MEPKTLVDGTPITMASHSVTGVFAGFFYIEEINRASGTMVVSSADVVEGKRVLVTGKMTTVSGERAIYADCVVLLDDFAIRPLGMSNRSLGGGSYGLQQGVTGGTGLNNIGLLIRAWGAFTKIDESTFTINDGSGVAVKCIVPSGVTLDPSWQYVTVTGISSCEMDGSGNLQRLIRVRRAEDIQAVQ